MAGLLRDLHEQRLDDLRLSTLVMLTTGLQPEALTEELKMSTVEKFRRKNMFLHLGSDVVIPLDSVIAITDYKTNKFVINRKFINHARKIKRLLIFHGHPKSVVVTANNQLYFSAISSVTLKKRALFIYEDIHDETGN